MKAPGYFGIAFVVLSGVIVVLSPWWPPLGASASEVTAYYRDHRLPFLVGNYLAIAAALPSFAQIAGLVLLLKRAEPEGWLWLATLSSALFAHAVGVIALVAYQTVPFLAASEEPGGAKALNDLAGASFGSFLIALAGFLAFSCWAIFRTRVLPAWFAWLGVPIAVAAALGSLGAIWAEPRWLAGGGIVSANATSAFFVWCLVLAVLFLRMKPQTP